MSRPPQLSKEVFMSTQHHDHHMDEQQQESALTTLSWVGGMFVVLAVLAFFYFGM